MDIGRTVGRMERWESKPRCACGQAAKYTVLDETGNGSLQLCRRHHTVWTVDRVRARLPRARYDLAESNATMEECRPNVDRRIRGIKDYHYFKRGLIDGVQEETKERKG